MERFSSFDGTRIAYSVVGTEPGDTAVLLHHGFASTSEINWVRPGLLDALIEAGRRVVLIDARGHGASDRPHDPAAYADRAMAKDVRMLIDRLGLESVDMAGYSMGAFVTLEVTPADERVRTICLGGAGTGQVGGQRSETTEAIIDALETDEPERVTNTSARAFRAFAIATAQDRLALAAIQRSRLALDVDAARSVAVPTLVVNGDRDDLIGDPHSLGALIAGSRTVIVPGNHISAVTKPEYRAELLGWAASAAGGVAR